MNFFNNLVREPARKKTEEAVIFYRRALKIARYTGVLPYVWISETQEVEISKSRLRVAIFVSQFLLYLLYEGFVTYRWIYAAYFDSKATTKERAALQYVAIAYGIPVIIHSCSFFNRDNLHNSINRLLQYVRNDFQRLPDNGGKLDKFGKFITILSLVGAVVISLNVSTIFRRPESPHLLTSLVPDVKSRKKWELIPLALVQGYIWCNQFASIYFIATLFMSHISVMGNALNRTRPHHHLTPERFFRATRKLDVLQGNFNALMRWVVWTGEVVLVTIGVFGICGSIWNEGAQAVRLLVVAMFGIGLLLTFFRGLGGVFETSKEILADWHKIQEPTLFFRKRMKSMRPIRAQVGGYFYVDAAMTLTLLSIISENTFNVLLAAGINNISHHFVLHTEFLGDACKMPAQLEFCGPRRLPFTVY